MIVKLLTPSDEDGCCCVRISKDLVILTLLFFREKKMVIYSHQALMMLTFLTLGQEDACL